MPTLAVVGRIAPRGQPAAMYVNGVPVQPTREPIAAQLTPLGAAVREACAAVEPCPVCGKYACDCDEWHEIMHTSPFEDACEVCGGIGCDCITPATQAALLARISADPHDYNNLSNLDLPY